LTHSIDFGLIEAVDGPGEGSAQVQTNTFSDDRQHFENVTGPVDLNRKELVETALNFRNGEIDIESEEVQKILHDQKDLDLKERYCIELRALKSIVRTRFKKIQELYSKRSSHPLIKPRSVTPMEETDWTDEIDDKITGFLCALGHEIRKLESEMVASMKPLHFYPTLEPV
jgi:hypothetical protein